MIKYDICIKNDSYICLFWNYMDKQFIMLETFLFFQVTRNVFFRLISGEKKCTRIRNDMWAWIVALLFDVSFSFSFFLSPPFQILWFILFFTLSNKHIYIYLQQSLSLSFTFLKLFKHINMSATYYIKAYFTKQDQQQPEIRRFPVCYSLFY